MANSKLGLIIFMSIGFIYQVRSVPIQREEIPAPLTNLNNITNPFLRKYVQKHLLITPPPGNTKSTMTKQGEIESKYEKETTEEDLSEKNMENVKDDHSQTAYNKSLKVNYKGTEIESEITLPSHGASITQSVKTPKFTTESEELGERTMEMSTMHADTVKKFNHIDKPKITIDAITQKDNNTNFNPIDNKLNTLRIPDENATQQSLPHRTDTFTKSLDNTLSAETKKESTTPSDSSEEFKPDFTDTFKEPGESVSKQDFNDLHVVPSESAFPMDQTISRGNTNKNQNVTLTDKTSESQEEIPVDNLHVHDNGVEKATLPITGDSAKAPDSLHSVKQSMYISLTKVMTDPNKVENQSDSNGTDASIFHKYVSVSNDDVENNNVDDTSTTNVRASVERKWTMNAEVNGEERSTNSPQISTKLTTRSTKFSQNWTKFIQSSTKSAASLIKSTYTFSSSSQHQTSTQTVFHKASSDDRMDSEDINFRTNNEGTTQAPCFFDPTKRYTQASLVTATVGGIFVGAVVIFLLFYARAKCKKYFQGDYRRVPMEYDFELNPRLKNN